MKNLLCSPGLVSVLATLLSVPALAVEHTNAPQSSSLVKVVATGEKRVAFGDLMMAGTGFQVLEFDTNNPAHRELRRKLLEAAELAGARAARDGIPANRLGEAGNRLEMLISAALSEVGLDVGQPGATTRESSAGGYPDFEIKGATPCYLELRTYSAATEVSARRSFHYSLSKDPAISRDALHLLIGFQMERVRKDSQTTYVPIRWRLITLADLSLDPKSEAEARPNGRHLNCNEGANALVASGAVR